MAKWHNILLALLIGGLLVLLTACNQQAEPENDAGSVLAAWFNDDWRDAFPPQRHDGPNMVYGDLVHKEDITMQIEGSNFTVADYQRIIRDYL